jgi:hypothetical protein
MDRRDYLLRLMEQLGRVMARVRELVIHRSLDEAASELEQFAQEAGVPLALIRVVDGNSRSTLLTTAGEPDPAKQLLAAEYLYLEALRAPAEAEALRARSLELYRGVAPLTDPVLAHAVADRIATLSRKERT